MRLLMVMVAGMCVVGCAEEPEYKGMAYSIRTMKDHGQVSDYYVGVDYKFALDHESTVPFTPAPEPVIHTPVAVPAGLASIADQEAD